MQTGQLTLFKHSLDSVPVFLSFSLKRMPVSQLKKGEMKHIHDPGRLSTETTKSGTNDVESTFWELDSIY